MLAFVTGTLEEKVPKHNYLQISNSPTPYSLLPTPFLNYQINFAHLLKLVFVIHISLLTKLFL